jgi:hypothetical protein
MSEEMRQVQHWFSETVRLSNYATENGIKYIDAIFEAGATLETALEKADPNDGCCPDCHHAPVEFGHDGSELRFTRFPLLEDEEKQVAYRRIFHDENCVYAMIEKAIAALQSAL